MKETTTETQLTAMKAKFEERFSAIEGRLHGLEGTMGRVLGKLERNETVRIEDVQPTKLSL